jgi:hypothetical protein
MAYPGLASNRASVMLSSRDSTNTCFLCHAQCGDWLWRFPHGLQIHNICFATRRLESPGATAKKFQGTYESSGGGTPAGDPWEYFEEASGNRNGCRAWRITLRTFIACADCLVRLRAPPSNGSRSARLAPHSGSAPPAGIPPEDIRLFAGYPGLGAGLSTSQAAQSTAVFRSPGRPG